MADAGARRWGTGWRWTYVALIAAGTALGLNLMLALHQLRVELAHDLNFYREENWTLQQASIHVERLLYALSLYGLGDPSTDHETLQLRFDIFWSRVQLLDSDALRSAYRDRVATPAFVVDLEATMVRAEPVVASLAHGDWATAAALRLEFEAAATQLRDLLMRRFNANVDEVYGREAAIAATYLRLALFAAGVFSSAALLVAVTVYNIGRQRRLLVEREAAGVEAEIARSDLQAVVDAVPAAIAAFDREGTVLFRNQEHALVNGADGPGAVPEGLDDVFASGCARPFREEQLPDARGDVRTLLTTLVPVADGGRAVDRVVAVSMDISERKKAEEHVRHLARHDGLTGLPNRSAFRAFLDEVAVPSRSLRPAAALMLIDIDRFKQLNDRFGHAAGDAGLRMVARRILACLQPRDMLARLGGDEFVLICPDIGGTERLAALADRILAAVQQPFLHEEARIELSLSVGIACWPEDGHHPETLLRNADLALYEAKAAGRGCWRRFEDAMHRDLAERRELASVLQEPPQDAGFFLAFQPKFRLSDRKLIGAEALLRWQHPTKGLIPPARFIPIAEEVDAIGALGDWVLREGCRHARAWLDRTGADVPVAVNVSPLQFRKPNFVDRVQDALQEALLPARCLELEVTEGLIIHDPVAAETAIERLRATGVRIALDDFGTGYSSLSYLQRFPFDTVKIDRSFVEGLPTQKSSVNIVRGVIAISHSLNLDVVAEGVETELQARTLETLRCDAVQGFLFGRPTLAWDFDRRHLRGPAELGTPLRVSAVVA